MTRARDIADLLDATGRLVLIEKKTIIQGLASATAFDFTNCFSSSYDVYKVEFYIIRNGYILSEPVSTILSFKLLS